MAYMPRRSSKARNRKGRRLSDGGPDHPRWVVAVCPNCHRRRPITPATPRNITGCYQKWSCDWKAESEKTFRATGSERRPEGVVLRNSLPELSNLESQIRRDLNPPRSDPPPR